MVQTYQAPIRIYHYPFEIVMQAYEKRFPSCELIPVFVDSEILDESYDKDGNVKITKRRCKLKVDAPYLLKKIIGMEFVYFIQINHLDYKSKILKIEAYNESFSTRVTMSEICYYKVHPQNVNWTCFEQEATLNIMSFFNFESILEKVVIKQYINSIDKGKEILMHFIKYMGLDKKGSHYNTNKISDSVLNNSIENSSKHSQEMFQFDQHCTKDHQGYILLTTYQNERLKKLKNMIAEKYNGKLPGDTHILRFLRARDFNYEKACEMLLNSLIWRKHHRIDKIMNRYFLPPVIELYFPGGWLTDHRDMPLYYMKLGVMDIKGLYNSLGMDGIIKHVLFVCEQGFELCQKRQFPNLADDTDEIDSTYLNDTVSFSDFDFMCLKTSYSSSLSLPNNLVDHVNNRTEKCVEIENGYDNFHDTNPYFYSPHHVDSSSSLASSYINYSWHLLLDLRGLGVKHLWTPGLKALLKILEIVEANYPETLTCLWILGAPKILPVLWTMVSPLIDDKTRSKFHFIKQFPPLSQICGDIFADNLNENGENNDKKLSNESLGIVKSKSSDDNSLKFNYNTAGYNNKNESSSYNEDDFFNCFSFLNQTPTPVTNQVSQAQSSPVQMSELCSSHKDCPSIAFLITAIKSSKTLQQIIADINLIERTVPKSYYLTEDVLNNQKNSLDQNIYHTCSLSKGTYHEVLIDITDPGSIITWDFDVAKYDCQFKFLYSPCNDTNANTSHKRLSIGHLQNCSVYTGIHSLLSTSSSNGSGEFKSDRLILVNESKMCREGDSVQGSHYVKTPGLYVLQWLFNDISSFLSPKNTNSAFDFTTLSTPKCKIMYFYKIIKSEDYNGSMSSLPSVTSGFYSMNETSMSQQISLDNSIEDK